MNAAHVCPVVHQSCATETASSDLQDSYQYSSGHTADTLDCSNFGTVSPYSRDIKPCGKVRRLRKHVTLHSRGGKRHHFPSRHPLVLHLGEMHGNAALHFHNLPCTSTSVDISWRPLQCPNHQPEKFSSSKSWTVANARLSLCVRFNKAIPSKVS